MEGQGEAVSLPKWCRFSHGVSGERCRCDELSGLEPHPRLRRGADAIRVSCWHLQVVCDVADHERRALPVPRYLQSRRPGPSLGQELGDRQRRVSPGQGRETGLIRIFIPAKILDNPALLTNDPNYINRLRASGSPALVKAWLDGDWNIIEGAFFPEFDPDAARHHAATNSPALDPFSLNGLGLRVPLQLGWWAVVQDDFIHDKRRMPKNAIIRYREWYGSSGAEQRPQAACRCRRQGGRAT